jgi:hypothetical protein
VETVFYHPRKTEILLNPKSDRAGNCRTDPDSCERSIGCLEIVVHSAALNLPGNA